ncbi:MAG: threonine--tRNA ligase [Candidatus Nanohaloarchaea archaeon]
MSITVELPDGSELDVPEGSTVEDVAYEIGEGLGNDTVAGKIDGDLVAKEEEVSDGDKVEIVTEDSDEYIEVLRHSAAHVFAQALKRIYGDEVKLTIGPWNDEGFYYDIDGVDLDEEDFEEIEEEMEEIVEEDLDIEREMLSREEAEEFFEDNEYKQEILEDEAAGGDQVSFYTQGEFSDLCKGPHVDSTGEVGGFKLLEIAGAYWRGDEENEMLTRVYGTAFPSEEELEEFMEQRREREKRDHRKIGQQMGLFSIPEVTGPGLPLYHPAGKTVLENLRDYVDSVTLSNGYERVETPHVFRAELWKESGHYEAYKDDMFLFDIDDEEYGLKAMNCPGHAQIFKKSGNWSYRDLPVRYYENGKVYRKEQRGELSGLSRVWGFTIDDGHLFCRPDQVKQEIESVLGMIEEVIDTLGLDANYMLATKPEKAIGSDEIWEKSEKALREVLEEKDLDFGIEEGEGAFYGPKIDITFEDALGREQDGPTVQVDFNMPKRFDLTYTDEKNEEQRPVMIHRALYGSYERMFMVLIEQYEGEFPTWLAPEQVRILPVSDDSLEYAREVKQELGDFRVEIEDRSWTVGKKIQAAHDDNVPYMLILGDDEEAEGTVSVRDREEREDRGFSVEEFREHLEEEVEEKRLEPDFLS